jgi:hypothetical protein
MRPGFGGIITVGLSDPAVIVAGTHWRGGWDG